MLSACTDSNHRADILSARFLPDSHGISLELTQQIDLSQAQRDALDHGIPLRLVYHIHACDHRLQRALWLRHAPLKRQYELQLEEQDEIRHFPRLTNLVAAMDRIRLPLDLPNTLQCSGQVYLRLDLAALPTPLRFPAFFSPETWQLRSRVHRWEMP